MLQKETAKVIRDYYYDMIKKGNFSLGDRQSNRYKARNDKISRVLNFDLVPLISKIVGKRVKASYTYFSGYIKGSDLPLHVDRAECEFTCSFFIAKDDTGISWPLYVEKQTDRGCTGRCNYTVTDEECIPLECEEWIEYDRITELLENCIHLKWPRSNCSEEYWIVLDYIEVHRRASLCIKESMSTYPKKDASNRMETHCAQIALMCSEMQIFL